ILSLDVEVLSGREPVLRYVQTWRPAPKNHQPVRFCEWQRAQQERVDHAEDRGVRTNPDRQGQNRHRGKARVLEQRSSAKHDITPESFHTESPSNSNASLLQPYCFSHASRTFI